MAKRPGAVENLGLTTAMFADSYRSRKVLVTGHTGFKGSWLSLWLAQLGAEVYGYALEPPTEPNLFDEAQVRSVLRGHEIGDVRDIEHLQSYMQEICPEIVFHLAAQPLVRLSYAKPVETYSVNIMGTVNLLEAVRQNGSVRVCQVITSDKCYENREWVYAYRESDPMGGFDPYSNSKGCAELVVSAYRRSFFPPERISDHGVSLASVRAGNVIGGGDWALDRIIPDCIRALGKGRSIQVRNPNAIRPWQYVLEPLSGYLWLASMQLWEAGMYEDGWNFGPSGAGNVSVAAIVDRVIHHWGEGEWVSDALDSNKAHEARFLKLDITKANDMLGWRAVLSVEDAVRDTVVWYKERQSGESLLRFSQQQIQNYTKTAQRAKVAWAMIEQN